jgi:hypothetical protein
MVTEIIGSAVTISGGALAASNLIIARRPDAKQLLEKLAPYQGWIGLVLFATGAWWTVHLILNLGAFSVVPLRMAMFAAATLTSLAVGFLLGFGLLNQYLLGSNEQAKAKAAEMRETLVAFQGPLGLAAVAFGVLALVMMFV